MKTGVLLVNLGTPDDPSVSSVRRYLTEFLNDPRVIDISPVGRWLLVNLIIVPFRSPKSAKLYKEVWRSDGTSPLLFFSLRQQELLQELLGDDYQVELAMRYQNPSIESALKKFDLTAMKELIVLPVFPQYASASTGSVHEKIMRILSKMQVVPEVKFISSFYDHPGFIEAFRQKGSQYDISTFDHVLMSFHGLPERQIRKADEHYHCLKDGCCDAIGPKNAYCYRAQCYATARAMATALNIPDEKYTVCFQSRLGRDPWIRPYSDHVITERAQMGDKKLLVFAPAFVADCLETLYEISVEYDQLFKENGGESVTMVESLNDSPAWIEAMKELIIRN